MTNIVITGSTRGIGFCLAVEFLKAGCNVTISGRGKAVPESASDILSAFSKHIIFVQCNVQSRKDVENLWHQSVAQWGRIDIWINNAGQNAPHQFVCDTRQQDVDRIIDTNVKGLIFGSQAAAKNMLDQGYGQIWNMEGLGSNNMIQKKTILYGTTKHALTYFTRGLAMELSGTDVFAGRLSPGMMLTDFIMKTPEGEASEVLNDPRFRRVFNILADKPETVARFMVPRILKNKKQNAHIVWLTYTKVICRFLLSRFKARRLLPEEG